jgi:two-component system chemotaxis response regulator CheY
MLKTTLNKVFHDNNDDGDLVDGVDLDSGTILVDDDGPNKKVSLSDVLRKGDGHENHALAKGDSEMVYVFDPFPILEAINIMPGTESASKMIKFCENHFDRNIGMKGKAKFNDDENLFFMRFSLNDEDGWIEAQKNVNAVGEHLLRDAFIKAFVDEKKKTPVPVAEEEKPRGKIEPLYQEAERPAKVKGPGVAQGTGDKAAAIKGPGVAVGAAAKSAGPAADSPSVAKTGGQGGVTNEDKRGWKDLELSINSSEKKAEWEIQVQKQQANPEILPGPRVLVVDDETLVRDLLHAMLRELKIRNVRMAADGAEVLDLMENHHEEFDVIISDWQMPGVDGLELLKRIRAKPPKQAFVMVTSKATKDLVVAAKKLGVNGFLGKPVSPARLMEALEHSVSKELLQHVNNP